MTTPLDLKKVKVLPLAERHSMARVEETVVAPDVPPQPCSAAINAALVDCVQKIRKAREHGASVMLIYGAHLIKNGAALILNRLIADGWLTHLATNGAGTIHDWEFAWHGASTESVRANVATGTFGTWDETSTNIHRALMVGALDGLGYGRALGRYMAEDGATLPAPDDLARAIVAAPEHPLTAARADLLRAMREQNWPSGRIQVSHRWKHASVLAAAWQHRVAMTVHPGIGYDIITNHPVFSGSVIGRAAELDFKLFAGAVAGLTDGVVLSVGSAIMGPQVFEKSLSCVNNLRLQTSQGVIKGHSIYIVDLQDGGGWDWTCGEPPKTNPAYYLRICKSDARMGGAMHYIQCDNVAFIQHLCHQLEHS